MATIARAPLSDEVYRQVLQRIHRGDLRSGRPSSGYRPRHPARRQPDAGPGGAPPVEPGRGAGEHRWARIPGPPPRSRGVPGDPAPSSAASSRSPSSSRPSPDADRLDRLQRHGPDPRADPGRPRPLPRPRGRVAHGAAEGVSQPPPARPDRLAPPGDSPLPRRLHAGRRPAEPLHPAPRPDHPGIQGGRTRQCRDSIRSTVAPTASTELESWVARAAVEAGRP